MPRKAGDSVRYNPTPYSFHGSIIFKKQAGDLALLKGLFT